VLAISIFPLIYSLTTGFLSYCLIPPLPPRVVWLGNYASLLQEPRFWNAILTTTLIALGPSGCRTRSDSRWRWPSTRVCPAAV
jgi:ABC-type sugar transport system permease subunit